MKSQARFLYVQICLGLVAVTSLSVRSAPAQTVEQRIVTGYGFWNDDIYSLHAHVNVNAGAGLPDGSYYLHFTENNGANHFNAPFQIINGQCSTPVFDWSASTYRARYVPDGGTTTAAIDAFGVGNTLGFGAPASGGITVTRQDTYFPDGNVPEPVHYDFDFNVSVGGGAALPPHTKRNDHKSGGNQCSQTEQDPMARYSVHSMLVSLNLEDRPLRYTPPRGPAIDFIVTYNQKESQQPAVFNYSNLGPRWTFNWLSYVSDDPTTQLASTSVYVPGGGAEIFTFDSSTQTFRTDAQSHATLVKTGAASYERRLPDGSKQVFGVTDGAASFPRRVFMSQLIDSAGNSMTIGYDSSLRITTVSDALGQITTISYEITEDPLKITRVTDPFGRFATFQYSGGHLATITDQIGIQSHFGYLSGTDSIDSLATPYGTTTFTSGQSGTNRWIEMTDPLGGKERVEYRDQAPGISPSDPVVPNAVGIANTGLDSANTFYWDKKAMLVAPGVYTSAKITHWLSNADGSTSGIAASEKLPLENRVWYTYAGQPDFSHIGTTANPSQVGRVLADGSTQLSQFEYNSLGKITKTTDPIGRSTTYVYASNNVDLLKVRQTTGTSHTLLHKFTYNSRHLPLTDTDASGQVTTYTYNASGQMRTRTNAKNETTAFAYGGTAPDGYLASITSPSFNGVSAVTTLGYDGFKRIRTITDTDNYAVTTDFDALDRKTKVTYPDSTYEQFQYTDNISGTMTLDLTASRDRRGLWTYRHYNANEQIDSVTDPANRTTNFAWCTCGALDSITDPKNQTTSFIRDLQGRVHQKRFADGTTNDYLFEGQTGPNTQGASSRLQSSTDARGQRTNYLYSPDDTVQQISYTDTAGQPLSPPTPSVSYTYDFKFGRVKTMADGTGTTTYGYNPIGSEPELGAGRLESIKGPLGHDKITFAYDELGRVVNRSIDGPANSDTWTFDSLGRVSSEVNNLGTFNYSYVGVTKRLSGMTYPGGQSTSYTYLPNAQDKRLQEIKNQTSPGALLSQFDYTYDAAGLIKTWTKNNPSLPTAQRIDLGYDNADQLLTASVKDSTTSALIKQYIYGYDLAGNRTSERIGNKTTVATPNNVNELVSQSGAINRTLTYDLNGSLINDGSSRTFEWDAANRLVAVNYSGTTNRSEFSYDGLNRCVKIVEKTDGVVNSIRKFVWCGTEKCEFRNANDGVTARVYSQGQHTGGAATFFTRDHLGSIREITDSNGTVVARYDYDSYGQSTTITGTNKPDFNFTGLYRHAKSNLDLATYRAYDPDLGRWLNRDPINEKGGLNLYRYVLNQPVALADPSGLVWGMDWLDNPSFDVPLQFISNFAAGFGDGLSFDLTRRAREEWDVDDVVDKCSGSYNTGWWSGLAYSFALGGTGSLNGGARSVFYSGEGALKAAQLGKGSGLLLADTLGGRALAAIDMNIVRIPDSVWRAASGIFAANARGAVPVFLRTPVNSAGVWRTVERPILDWFGNVTLTFR
jgi:RHS repeat-associated protein